LKGGEELARNLKVGQGKVERKAKGKGGVMVAASVGRPV
jgi:hypothetical protein